MTLLQKDLLQELESFCSGAVIENVSMAKKSNWQVGGHAAILVTPSSITQIVNLRKVLSSHAAPYLVIGNTTNLLFTDEKINAVIVQLGPLISDVHITGQVISAQAGVWVPKLARKAMQAGLSGLEHICGIPGTLGGLVAMNGGSKRKGIGDSVLYVKTVDRKGLIKQYTRKECKFGYRSSIFQEIDEIIVEVAVHLNFSISKGIVHSEMLSILGERSKKFPRKKPNCGSVFVSNPKMYKLYGPPGKVIEECGLKGLRKGDAQVSDFHANFIVNHGNASAEDILFLINYVRNKVFDKTGCMMKVEVKSVSSCGRVLEI